MSMTTLNGILKAKVLSLISWRIFAARSSLRITATGEAQPDQNKEGSHEACDVEENVRTIGEKFKRLDWIYDGCSFYAWIVFLQGRCQGS